MLDMEVEAMRVLFILLLALALAACESDGDREHGGAGIVPLLVMGSAEAEVLPVYDFQIRATPADDPLTIVSRGDAGIRRIAVEFGDTLKGEVGFDVDGSNDLRIHNYTVYAGSSLSVSSDIGNTVFLGAFDVEVIDDLAYLPRVPHHPANRGFFQVVTAEEIVNVQVIAGPFSSVEISLGLGPAVPMSWDQLADLLDDELAPEWQRRAALATEVFDFVLIQMARITDTFNFINEELLVTNPAVMACDAFTGTPPELVLAQGQSALTWLGPGDEPMTGDDFDWTFIDCWFDDSGSSRDTLLNGGVGLRSLVWEVDNLSQLVGVGFHEVSYDSLEVAGTVEDPVGVFALSPEEVLTVKGGFDLVFEEQDD
jgi:hypothetical protein